MTERLSFDVVDVGLLKFGLLDHVLSGFSSACPSVSPRLTHRVGKRVGVKAIRFVQPPVLGDHFLSGFSGVCPSMLSFNASRQLSSVEFFRILLTVLIFID